MGTDKDKNEMTPSYLAKAACIVKTLRLFSLVLCCLSILSCFYTTTSVASEVVKFEATKSYKSKKIALRGELFKPKGSGPFPAVVLMHGCGGLQSAVRMALSSYAELLVENGFAVLNLDSFGPRRNSGGQVCASFNKLREAREYRTADAFDAMQYLKAQNFVDSENIFLMGQSNGGSVAINAANSNNKNTKFRAVVAFYPWCGAFGSRNVDLGSPLMVLGGAKDDWVPPQFCSEVVSNGEKLEVTIYPNAPHSFDVNVLQQRYLGKLIGYDRHAAVDSRLRMLAFFNENMSASVKNNKMRLAQN